MQTNPPGVVLDTNVVLDWLLFADPSCAPLAAAITDGQVRWLACTRMRDELAGVLARGLAMRHGVATSDVLSGFDRHAVMVGAPAAVTLLCTDTDDQVFVDLACGTSARWLVSRDRAVLRLGRRAVALGLHIMMPARWRLE